MGSFAYASGCIEPDVPFAVRMPKTMKLELNGMNRQLAEVSCFPCKGEG